MSDMMMMIIIIAAAVFVYLSQNADCVVSEWSTCKDGMQARTIIKPATGTGLKCGLLSRVCTTTAATAATAATPQAYNCYLTSDNTLAAANATTNKDDNCTSFNSTCAYSPGMCYAALTPNTQPYNCYLTLDNTLAAANATTKKGDNCASIVSACGNTAGNCYAALVPKTS